MKSQTSTFTLRPETERQLSAIRAAFIGIGAAMVPVARQFCEALQKFDRAVEEQYRAAGAPYGDSSEGRWQWMNEQGEEFRAQEQAREAARREHDLADFRRLGAEARAKILARETA